jgi:hypothetical protein
VQAFSHYPILLILKGKISLRKNKADSDLSTKLRFLRGKWWTSAGWAAIRAGKVQPRPDLLRKTHLWVSAHFMWIRLCARGMGAAKSLDSKGKFSAE